MNKSVAQWLVVWGTAILFGAAAAGYLVVPASMLAVVGIEATPTTEFLVRTLAAVFVGLIPISLTLRHRTGHPSERTILFGLAVYMAVGSAVDLHAYLVGLVGMAAVPSILARTALGLALIWIAY